MSESAIHTRFATIDALRGVAAIAVMLYHAGPLGSDGAFSMPGGYLAVDLFFALSGFVTAHAYADRLSAGMGTGAFLRLRIARLWPMLLLGATLGIALHGGHAGMLFLLPNPHSPDILYPANPPFWSLLFEMIAYAGFVLLYRRIGARSLAIMMGIAALVLVWGVASPYPVRQFGADWATFGFGLARLAFAFGIGLAVYGWTCRATLPSSRPRTGAAWLVPAGFLLIAWWPGQGDGLALLAILVGLPVLTAAAVRWEIPQRRVCSALGDLSYPLYCIHVPLIAAFALEGGGEVVLLGTLPLLALAIDRRVDSPARAALRHLLPGPPALAAARG